MISPKFGLTPKFNLSCQGTPLRVPKFVSQRAIVGWGSTTTLAQVAVLWVIVSGWWKLGAGWELGKEGECGERGGWEEGVELWDGGSHAGLSQLVRGMREVGRRSVKGKPCLYTLLKTVARQPPDLLPCLSVYLYIGNVWKLFTFATGESGHCWWHKDC